ncbi:MAG TPA: hypothetical protein VK453_25835 [Micromonosporaceae bacterium]|nr:hypothetical protein [Micromonosporaceae bacterium]
MDRLGVDLHEGDTIVDLGGEHVIASFREYPGRFIGGHARIAYYEDGGEHTVRDEGHFNILDPVVERGEAA